MLCKTHSIDVERRRRIMPNHTYTHVLNWALREVSQRGVNEETKAWRLLHAAPLDTYIGRARPIPRHT